MLYICVKDVDVVDTGDAHFIKFLRFQSPKSGPKLLNHPPQSIRFAAFDYLRRYPPFRR